MLKLVIFVIRVHGMLIFCIYYLMTNRAAMTDSDANKIPENTMPTIAPSVKGLVLPAIIV